MDEKRFADALSDVLAETDDASDDLNQNTVMRIETFEEVGMLTNHAGLVVRMNNGSEYQLTIVRAR